MSAFYTSLLVYGWLALAVLAAELLGLSDRVPWNSLTWTIGQLMARHWGYVVFPAISSLLLIFLLHIKKHNDDKPNEPEGRN
jgi:hypothetical protein